MTGTVLLNLLCNAGNFGKTWFVSVQNENKYKQCIKLYVQLYV